MFGFDFENMTGAGLFEKLVGGSALAGLVTFAIGVYKKRTGKDGESPFDILPKWAQDFLDTGANWINSIIDMVLGWVRNTFFKEEVVAENDITARIDKAKPALAKFDTALGAGVTEHIIGLTRDAAKSFTSFNMGTEATDVLQNAKKLNAQISSYIVEKLNAKHPNHTTADDEKFKKLADEAAAAVTGVTADLVNPNLINSGYAAMLLQVQTGVKAAGDYVAPTAPPPIPLNTAKLGKSTADLAVA